VRRSQETGLHALEAVSRHLDWGGDLPTFFGGLSETVAALMRAGKAAFWRLDEQNVLALQPHPHGFDSDSVMGLRVPLDPNGAAIVERVVFHDEVDVGQLDRGELDRSREVLDALGARDVIAVSWRVGDRVLGELAAYDSLEGFTEADSWVLRVAARAAGLVWQYREAEQQFQSTVRLLEQAVKSRRSLLHRVVTAAEDERCRVARDLHDDSLQSLTAAELRLRRLHTVLESSFHIALADDVEAMLRRTDNGLRQLLFDLRPSGLDLPAGLKSAVRRRVQHLQEEFDLRCEIDLDLPDNVPEDTRQIVYRILQESLTNVEKHSRASTLQLALAESRDGVYGRVKDDGVGFCLGDTHLMPGHIGLASMQERAEIAGGWWRVTTAPDQGTCVEFWVPRKVSGRP